MSVSKFTNAEVKIDNFHMGDSCSVTMSRTFYPIPPRGGPYHNYPSNSYVTSIWISTKQNDIKKVEESMHSNNLLQKVLIIHNGNIVVDDNFFCEGYHLNKSEIEIHLTKSESNG